MPALLLELAFVDDSGMPQARESVRVRIMTDGSVLIPDESNRAVRVAFRMTEAQRQRLLRETIIAGQLAKCDNEKLNAAIAAAWRLSGRSARVAGAADTVIRYRQGQHLREIRCHALSVAAARFPDFPEVQRLHDVQLRLQNVGAVARAGGYEASERLAELANRTLLERYPGTPKLTAHDLSMFRELSTGSRYVQFYRRQHQEREELLVSLFESPGHVPSVTVLINPTRRTDEP